MRLMISLLLALSFHVSSAQKLIKVNVWGHPTDSLLNPGPCELELRKKYGFYYEFKGCEIPWPKLFWRYKEGKLRRRNGKGWKEHYEKELNACKND